MKKKQSNKKFLKKIFAATATATTLGNVGVSAIYSTSLQVSAEVVRKEGGDYAGKYNVGHLEDTLCGKQRFKSFAPLPTEFQETCLNNFLQNLQCNDFDAVKKVLQIVEDVPQLNESDLYIWNLSFKGFIEDNQENLPPVLQEIYQICERDLHTGELKEDGTFEEGITSKEEKRLKKHAQIFHLLYEWLIRTGERACAAEELKVSAQENCSLLGQLSHLLQEIHEGGLDVLLRDKHLTATARQMLKDQPHYQSFVNNNLDSLVFQQPAINFSEWNNYAKAQSNKMKTLISQLQEIKDDSCKERALQKAINVGKEIETEVDSFNKDLRNCKIEKSTQIVDSNLNLKETGFDYDFDALTINNSLQKLINELRSKMQLSILLPPLTLMNS